MVDQKNAMAKSTCVVSGRRVNATENIHHLEGATDSTLLDITTAELAMVFYLVLAE